MGWIGRVAFRAPHDLEMGGGWGVEQDTRVGTL